MNTLRNRILMVARKTDPEIGDGAMMVECEFGYLVGAQYYISKASLSLA